MFIMPYSSMVQSITSEKSQGQGCKTASHIQSRDPDSQPAWPKQARSSVTLPTVGGRGPHSILLVFLGLASELILVQFQVQNLSLYMG